MARQKSIVDNTRNYNRLFKAYCKLNSLKDGDVYYAVDYLFWIDKMQCMANQHIKYTNYEETTEKIISWIEDYVSKALN